MDELSEQEVLERLAELQGIVREYADIWGHRHPTSLETTRAILAAMGLRVSTAAEARAELEAREAAPWLRPCDPVLVHRRGAGGLRWSFRLPAEEDEAPSFRLRWEIWDEAGRRCREREEGPGLKPVEGRLVGGRRYLRFELPLPEDLEVGYYDVKAYGLTRSRFVEGDLRLIVVPARCYEPPPCGAGSEPGGDKDRRIWGLALQVYALRSDRNWGVGDFRDLAEVLDWAAGELGAGVIGVNPLHALRNARPYHISPYSPDSRLYLNALYVDVEGLPEFGDSAAAQRVVRDPEFQARLARARKGDTVDYDGVWAAKLAALEAVFATFQARHLRIVGRDLEALTERGWAFLRFVRDGGVLLEAFAVFQALAEEFRRRQPPLWSWRDWPEPYRRPDSPEVRAFRAERAERVRFFQYLQWAAAEQLAAVAERARARGMAVGLYHDLALAGDGSGSEAWTFQDVLALRASCGAPPDSFSPEGQNWGVPPVDPHRLRASGYRMFIELLRKNFAYGGALRLDHVMSLFRLFWIPEGLPASAGTYVCYPAEDLLGILALESLRHRTLVIGEDLGTVPDWVRDRLAAANVLSYRVFYFEREPDGRWKAPAAYPPQAAAVATTHDLPPLAGYWSGRDIEERFRLGILPDERARASAWEERRRDRARILEALKAEGLLPDGLPDDAETVAEMTPDLCQAVHLFLARTPARVMLAALEDVIGACEQVNLPGTVDAHPNWSRKYALSVEELGADPRPRALAQALRALRPWAQGRGRAAADACR
ncbi:4-alpha-glucanotransferase [Nitrospira sp. Kam-Ns4a]